jgi:hypothetical protein
MTSLAHCQLIDQACRLFELGLRVCIKRWLQQIGFKMHDGKLRAAVESVTEWGVNYRDTFAPQKCLFLQGN